MSRLPLELIQNITQYDPSVVSSYISGDYRDADRKRRLAFDRYYQRLIQENPMYSYYGYPKTSEGLVDIPRIPPQQASYILQDVLENMRKKSVLNYAISQGLHIDPEEVRRSRYYAIRNNYTQQIKYLIDLEKLLTGELDISPDEVNQAVRQYRSSQPLRILLEAGGDPNSVDGYGSAVTNIRFANNPKDRKQKLDLLYKYGAKPSPFLLQEVGVIPREEPSVNVEIIPRKTYDTRRLNSLVRSPRRSRSPSPRRFQYSPSSPSLLFKN